ncbi:hypothetical protein BI292_06140 [Pseudomonas sp. 43NM1]|uniref:hypothetical protein n=1 Tax=Pseudomonas sp. 43NM1 TaxID=1904755 RepID=UPI000C325BC9|nr:hypothetical protein [Pseudomonas sp. 43NM1]PKH12587.1 hypothetical protein BI292_06140 [Pseudomonas sp. 43NM1]
MSIMERSFPIHDLIIALLRDQNIHTGWWGLNMHFNANGASVLEIGKTGTRLPGLAIAVSGVTLVPTKDGEAGSVDASLVNPARTDRATKTAPSKGLH